MSNNKKKKSIVPKILIGLVILVIFSLGFYLLYKFKKWEFNVWKIIGIIIGSVILLFIVFKAISFLIVSLGKGSFGNKDSLKDPVPLKRAIFLFKQSFYDWNEIPCRWVDKEWIPINPSAVIIKNTRDFPDPKFQTPDKFFQMELIVNEGLHRGMCIATIETDLGEEFIKENSMQRLAWNKSFAFYDMETDKYPLASSSSYEERATMKSIDYMEEGYSKEEAEKRSRLVARNVPVYDSGSQKRKRKVIRSESLQNNFPQLYEEEQEVADEDDLENARSEYKRRILQ